MAKIVRSGDSSDHNGRMVSATGLFRCNGKIVCVNQDMHECGIAEHGTTPVTGTATFMSNGKRVIKTGDKAGCGAVIIGGSDNSFT